MREWRVISMRRLLPHRWVGKAAGVLLLGWVLLVGGCNTGGGNGSLSSQRTPSAQSEQQTIVQLLALYRTAFLQEDIDRLQELLQSATAQANTLARQRQAEEEGFEDPDTFRDTISQTFRSLTVIGHDIPQAEIRIAADRQSVAFLEAESVIDPVTLEQRTRVFHTTFQIVQEEVGGVITFRISAVKRDGPVVQVRMPEQVRAGTAAPIEVRELGGTFPLVGVEVEVVETGVVKALEATDGVFQGLVTPPELADPEPLRVRLQQSAGGMVVIQHRYRLWLPGDGAVNKISGTGGTAAFFAVAVAADGTVWGGGREPPFGGGTLYRVPPGTNIAEFVGDLLADPEGRVEDFAFDQLGRLHIIFFSLRANGDVILDQGVFCQTVNILDEDYPFRNPRGDLSASTRAVAAGSGDIWLFGSDGGVARVTDTFRDGQCPATGIEVRYDPVFRREDRGLLSNTVPAMVAATDGAVWFGTAFGLTHLQNDQFAPVPFDPALSLQGEPETLEEFFQEVARAIFENRSVQTIMIGDSSFADLFGSPLVKADLIFSAVEDAQGRLWAGTLGGGIRRVDADNGTPQDTLHLTRQDGLASNIIFSLAVGPDDSIWAATEEGVSRIREVDGRVLITTFSALDGLALPVRDAAVDAAGIVWLATDGGLFQIVP